VWQPHKLSIRDVAFALDIGIACLITYWGAASLLPYITGKPTTPVGILWAVISAAFVYRNTRGQSWAAGLSRLIGTLISLVLCLAYLYLFTASAFGMAILIVTGTLVMMLLGRRDEIGLTAITTAVVMVVAAGDPDNARAQPVLRLLDTTVGIAVGVGCKWIASQLFDKIVGESEQ
jgi:uncharacterized membrane protein YccC